MSDESDSLSDQGAELEARDWERANSRGKRKPSPRLPKTSGIPRLRNLRTPSQKKVADLIRKLRKKALTKKSKRA